MKKRQFCLWITICIFLIIQMVFVFLFPFLKDIYDDHYYVSIMPWLLLILSTTFCVVLYFTFSLIKFNLKYTAEEIKRQEERTYRTLKDIDEHTKMVINLEFRQQMERSDREKMFLKEIINSLKTEKGQEIISPDQLKVILSFLDKKNKFITNINREGEE